MDEDRTDSTRPEPDPQITPAQEARAEENYRTTADPALQYAWRLYLAYSDASKRQKTLYTRVRQWIILLGLTSSVVAVVIALPLIAGVPLIKDLFRMVLVVLPIAVAVLMGFANQFTPNTLWIVYRYTAQSILREIYLYRMQAGPYAAAGQGSAISQQQTLSQRVRDARATTDKLEAIEPFLQKHSGPDEVIKRVQERYKRKQYDKGFGPMTGQHYIEERVSPQYDWYINKLDHDYKQSRRNRILMLVIAGLGSVFAALSADLAWLVVITTATVAALGTWMQLEMQGLTYGNYHLAASQLNDRLLEWQMLTQQQQALPANAAQLVADVEEIFRVEETAWMQQALQSQDIAEKSLVKNVSEWTNAQLDRPALLTAPAAPPDRGGGG